MSEPAVKEDAVVFGDSRVEISSFDRYKGRKNVTDRVGILSATLLRARTHYVEKGATGKTFKCLTTPTHQGVCCKHVGEPDQKFGLVLFQYLTDEQGQLLTDEKLSGKVKLWVISESRYAELSTIHKEFPLLNAGFDQPQVDLLLKCSEEKFQRMAFTPCRDAFWKKKQVWYDAMMAKESKARQRLLKVMGSDLSELEILDLLEVDSGNPIHGSGGGSGEIDISDIID